MKKKKKYKKSKQWSNYMFALLAIYFIFGFNLFGCATDGETNNIKKE